MNQPERELPFAAAAFNLIVETGEDPLRVTLDRLHEAEKAAAAREYQLRAQRVFFQCPGFLEGDAPTSEQGRGSVVIQPECLKDAVSWLKKRFILADTVEIADGVNGLRVELAPKPKPVKGIGRRNPKALFAKPEQFELGIRVESFNQTGTVNEDQ